MSTRYRTQAVNRDGGEGWSRVPGGLEVPVASPLGPNARAGDAPDQTNPEQLLALAWATCLNATVRAVIERRHRSAVRVEVALVDAEGATGFEFDVAAFVSVLGVPAEEAESIAASAHARCPISRLLHDARTVSVHAESFDPDA